MANINNIEVSKGAHIPIIKQFQNDDGFHFTDGLGDAEEIQKINYSNIEVSKTLSPLRIIELIKKYPNEINLICLGPLTNLAAAYMLYPDIVNKLKFTYIMGGTTKCYGNHISTAEYNSAYDFISAKIVFEKFKNLIITPWEPTVALSYSMESLKNIKNDFESKNINYNKTIFTFWELILQKYDIRNKGIGLEICDLYSVIPAFNLNSVEKFCISNLDVVIDSRENVGMTIYKNKNDIKNIEFKDFWNEKVEKKENGMLPLKNKHIVISQFKPDELHKDFISIFTELV